MKLRTTLTLLLAVCLTSTIAAASTFTTWNWAASPTQDAQGNPLAPPLYYQVFVSGNNGPLCQVATVSGTTWDQEPTPGVTYRIYVRAVDAWGRTSPMSESSLPFTAPAVSAVPSATAASVGPAVPNPFNPITSIAYTVPEGVRGQVALRILDVRGRLVTDLAADPTPGDHAASWDGTDRTGRSAPAGIYLVQFRCGPAVAVTKVTLIE
ncbi:MAG: FlgD immunoglobulin-like domain containing protein [Candidatus Krumholzibacteriia bacterium]